MSSTLCETNPLRVVPGTPADGAAIGSAARQLDARPLRERLQLEPRTLIRLAACLAGYLVLVALGLWIGATTGDRQADWQVSAILIPSVIVAAFLFETLDAAAGMGFGTALAPLLFALGHEPLAVVPVLLLSESLTGILSAAMHHEFSNVQFSLRGPANEATKLALMIAGVGVAAIAASVSLTYLAIALPSSAIKTYVALLVLLMGLVGIVRRFGRHDAPYRPKRMLVFALWAGVNKGIGGGGYGPVVTLGQIYSGVYAKSAAAITSLAEGVVSIAGVVAFLAINAAGVQLDFRLLPSVLIGSVLAAILAPYLVRIMPNRSLAVLVPAYAVLLAALLLVN